LQQALTGTKGGKVDDHNFAVPLNLYVFAVDGERQVSEYFERERHGSVSEVGGALDEEALLEGFTGQYTAPTKRNPLGGL
jgi:hypothetical protein